MKKFLKELYLPLLFTAVAVSGLVLGCISVSRADEKTLDFLSLLTGGFVQSSASVSEHFFSAVGSDFIMLFILYFLGFLLFSYPFSALLVLFCGVGVGVSVGFLFRTYGVNSILYSAVLIAPSASVSILTLIFASCESVKMTTFLFKRCFSKDALPLNREKFTKYSLQFLSFSCILVLSGILDTALNRIFSSIISL